MIRHAHWILNTRKARMTKITTSGVGQATSKWNPCRMCLRDAYEKAQNAANAKCEAYDEAVNAVDAALAAKNVALRAQGTAYNKVRVAHQALSPEWLNSKGPKGERTPLPH